MAFQSEGHVRSLLESQPMRITFVTTGGTIDKIYFDANSTFEIGESMVDQILTDARSLLEYDVLPLMRKDSLNLTDDDRRLIYEQIDKHPGDRFVVTHGTDTMAKTAEALQPLRDKTIVLTGSLSPARFRTSDAVFNVGMAVAAVQIAPPGVYLAINGQIFHAGTVVKNVEQQQFEKVK